MLNIHLNGDLVRCPDIRSIHRRLAEQRLSQCRCIYGFEEKKCQTWYDYCTTRHKLNPTIIEDDELKPESLVYNSKVFPLFGRCILSSSELCPMHIKRRETGLMKKNFKIDHLTYRKISSASHYLIKKSNYKTLFLTLTFPQFKKYLSDNEANKLFSKFIENLRRRHNCEGYIAVRENGAKFGRVHFHLLLSIDFVSFPGLNSYWCDIISDYCEFAKNAVQTDPKTKFINNPTRAMRYVCKYFSKSKGTISESRVIFVSNNLLSRKEVDYYDDIKKEFIYKRVSNIKQSFSNENNEFFTVNDLFDKYTSLSVCGTSDYTTAFRFESKVEFEQFCNEYLYKIFGLFNEKNQMLTD